MTSEFDPSGRRKFLASAAAALGILTISGTPALAAKRKRSVAGPSSPVPVRPSSERSLKLLVVNTGERWEGAYWRDGNYLPDAMKRLDAVLRDYKAGAVMHMDPKLYDQMWEIHQRVGSNEPWRVISAYRSSRTNAVARKSHRGVARNSFHIQGRAVDIDLADRSVRAIRQAAMSLQAGGVGQYPRSDFVHIDTGPVRNWG
ncbi:MAG: DUF882 domain-containing protein [Alphaproteobacteria bacterium]|nr:DUF882 domain-containing protein [Alphaproteobacteria bacterium]